LFTIGQLLIIGPIGVTLIVHHFIIWEFSLKWEGRGKLYDYLEYGDLDASTNRGTPLDMLIVNHIELDIFQLIWKVMNIKCGGTSKLHVGWWLASVK